MLRSEDALLLGARDSRAIPGNTMGCVVPGIELGSGTWQGRHFNSLNNCCMYLVLFYFEQTQLRRSRAFLGKGSVLVTYFVIHGGDLSCV